MKNNVVLTGDGPLFWEVRDFLCDFSVQVFTLEETIPPSVRAVIDVEIGMDEKKQNNLQYVESQIASNVPIFSSVLYRTATEIASWLQHPERVVGFSPLMINQIHVLEVSCPLQAEGGNSWQQALNFWKEFGKEIEIVGDEPGLVFPRVLALLVNEAAFALSEGVARARDIDLAMKKGTNYPFGPLEWADEIGIDQIIAILLGLQRELGEDRYRPAPLLRKMSYAGFLGQASARGFYLYERS